MKKDKKLSHAAFLKAAGDSRKAASAADLTYVCDQDSGITRKGSPGRFSYHIGNKKVTDKPVLERIKKLVIPPAWKNVWICRSPNGHIQATGTDIRGRKQYRYHPKWNSLRNETKFHRLYEFGKTLPILRKKVKKDIATKELNRDKVLATVINLMDKTYIRVGNNEYEKANGSYGLTTLKDKHVKLSKDKIVFSFTGKKGIDHTIPLKDKKLASIVKQCRDIPGKPLFQYYDSDGENKPIDSGMVNNYIKEATEDEFTAKDFRVWAGSLQALEYFRSNSKLLEQAKDAKKTVVAMLDDVSKKLGNTRNVCRKYYVHPALITLCEENKLTPELFHLNGLAKNKTLSPGEYLLMRILRKSI
jgi:DNA topoisomerase-1